MKKIFLIIMSTLLAAISIGSTAFAEEAITNTENATRGKVKLCISFTDEEKEEINAAVSEKILEILGEKLQNGEITEEEMTSFTESMEKKHDSYFGKHNSFQMRGKEHGMKSDTSMEKPEITEEQKSEMSEKITTHLSAMLESEVITEDEYNEYLTALESGDLFFIDALRPEAKNGIPPHFRKDTEKSVTENPAKTEKTVKAKNFPPQEKHHPNPDQE